MNNAKIAVDDVEDEEMPQLQVVAAKNGACKTMSLSAPLVLPARIHPRRSRAELAVLGWSIRAPRLAGRR